MTDGSAACPCCGDLVVVVAVKCLQCGEVLGTSRRAHDHASPHSSPPPRRVVYDIPARERRPAGQVTPPPPMRALPRARRGAPVTFRMETSYSIRPPRTRIIQDVLDRGCPEDLPPGTHVEVRNRFNEQWAGGFVVDAAVGDGYRLRRAWNGALLPVIFKEDDVRRADMVPTASQ